VDKLVAETVGINFLDSLNERDCLLDRCKPDACRCLNNAPSEFQGVTKGFSAHDDRSMAVCIRFDDGNKKRHLSTFVVSL